MYFLGKAWRGSVTSAVVLLAGVSTLAGCPMEDDAPAAPGPATPDSGAEARDASAPDAAETPATPDATAALATHAGLVSVQDIAIANLPQAGHGLTVNVFFNAARTPAWEERAGSVSGCRAYAYDAISNPAPPEEDHGDLSIEGIRNGALSCRFVAGRGYTCPTATGTATVTTGSPSGGVVTIDVPGASFGAADVGRWLRTSGAANEKNNGAFPIVGVPSASQLVVVNPAAVAEAFAASFEVVAGAGPTPNDPYSPFSADTKVAIRLEPNGPHLAIPTTEVRPGDGFSLDGASAPRITNVPVTGEPITLSCGDRCGSADGTIVRITTTDGDLTGLSPVAMPMPKQKLVEIQCVELGTGTVTVPAQAMKLLAEAHAASPITRIRTAFMRDGLAVVPSGANVTYLATGRGLLGFTKP